jgi:hypothetical protein
MIQARRAAQRLDARAVDPGAAGPAVEQLVRCARLSQDAAHTLDWALDTLGAHATNRADSTACQLLRAARARLDAATPGTPAGHAATNGSRSFATN